MGSYLSIDNNTSDTWQCTIGPDEAALKIAGIVVSIVAAAAAVIGTAGSAAPVATALVNNGIVSVFGVSTSALATATAAADAIASSVAIAGSVSEFGMTVANGINDNLIDNGYQTIKPGEKHQWGKMSLSLWQQGTCVRTIIKDEKTVQTDTLYMRPIFSGATDNSNLDHQIQWWIDKWGVESSSVEGTTDTQSRRSKKVLAKQVEDDEDSEDSDEESYDSYDTYESDVQEGEGETIYFYSNGTSTYNDPNAHKKKKAAPRKSDDSEEEVYFYANGTNTYSGPSM